MRPDNDGRLALFDRTWRKLTTTALKSADKKGARLKFIHRPMGVLLACWSRRQANRDSATQHQFITRSQTLDALPLLVINLMIGSATMRGTPSPRRLRLWDLHPADVQTSNIKDRGNVASAAMDWRNSSDLVAASRCIHDILP